MSPASPPTVWGRREAAAWLPVPSPEDDKYRRGTLGVRTGSSAFPGAALLGVEAAWRTGVGMLRFVPQLDDAALQHDLPSPAHLVMSARPETVVDPDAKPSDADAWLLGSGTDPRTRSDAEREALESVLSGAHPVVVDAGALELALAGTAPRLLTPHRGEFAVLWRAAGLEDLPAGWPRHSQTATGEAASVVESAASRLARTTGAVVLLKGATTVIASPDGALLTAGPATPWLASAGTGDVLAGICGALVAAHTARGTPTPDGLAKIGATASVLHDTAARLAASDASGREDTPITALDVAHRIPAAVAALSRERD